MSRSLLAIVTLLAGCSLNCPEYTYEEARCQVSEAALDLYKKKLIECEEGNVSGA